jgi:hypothetical protein
MNVFIGQDGSNERMLRAGPTGMALGNGLACVGLANASCRQLTLSESSNSECVNLTILSASASNKIS